MMKLYICPECGWIRMVSRRKDVECHKCGNLHMKVTNLDLDRYSAMSEQERKDYSDGWLYIHRKSNK